MVLGLAGKLKQAAFDAGLICYPMPGTRDGKHGDHLLLAPPLILTKVQIDELTSKLGHALEVVFAPLV